jgi:hypothetical protein
VKAALNRLALLIVLVTLVVWTGTGAHCGWTKTSMTVMRKDEVTGLEYPERQKKFVLGVEWLGAGLALAAALCGTALFIKAKSKQPT